LPDKQNSAKNKLKEIKLLNKIDETVIAFLMFNIFVLLDILDLLLFTLIVGNIVSKFG